MTTRCDKTTCRAVLSHRDVVIHITRRCDLNLIFESSIIPHRSRLLQRDASTATVRAYYWYTHVSSVDKKTPVGTWKIGQ